jgi:hypothetical protein
VKWGLKMAQNRQPSRDNGLAEELAEDEGGGAADGPEDADLAGALEDSGVHGHEDDDEADDADDADDHVDEVLLRAKATSPSLRYPLAHLTAVR